MMGWWGGVLLRCDCWFVVGVVVGLLVVVVVNWKDGQCSLGVLVHWVGVSGYLVVLLLLLGGVGLLVDTYCSTPDLNLGISVFI